MKWMRRAVVVTAVLVCGLVGVAWLAALRTERPVGFQVARATDADGQPFAIGVWYPIQARPRPTTLLGPLLMDVAPNGPVSGRGLPLVVISHGNGGGLGSHADLALALADAGYVVAAPMHTGDNYADQSADEDTNVPYATNTRLVREALGPQVEFHSVPGAGHFSFLAPCGLLRPPGICSDPGQFDRKAFHADMNAGVVAFFSRNMKSVAE